MSDPLAAAKLKAETAYNAAADYFDAEPLGFWTRYGRRTIERLRLRRGAHVLDVCCGAGASALPAAQAVGPEGQVIAVDLATELLALGQAKAQSAGVQCVEFRRGDMTDLGFPDRHFDAVVCVFGIFFVPDMGAPGGGTMAHGAARWTTGDHHVGREILEPGVRDLVGSRAPSAPRSAYRI